MGIYYPSAQKGNTIFATVAEPGYRNPTQESFMRIRSKEIRTARKREHEQLKVRIKELKAIKAAPVVARPRTRTKPVVAAASS